MNLALLPTEILLEILKFCEIKDLLNIKCACRRLNEITNFENFWSFKCCRDYNVTCKGRHFKTLKNFILFMVVHLKPPSSDRLCSTELTIIVLHRYGHLIGTYKYKFFNYGGLLEINFQDGLNVWLYKQNLRDDKNSLTKNLVFKIEKDPLEAKVRILCCFQTENPHNGILKKSMQGRRYIFQCGERDRIQDLHEGLRTFYGYNMIYNACLDLGAELFPIYIQDIHDVPKSLIENGAFQKDLVRPGLYRAVHKIRDDLLILLSYKENLRINGFLVSSDYGYGSDDAFRVNLKKLGDDSNIRTEMNNFEANFLSSLNKLSESYTEIFGGKCKCWFKCFSKIIGSGNFTEAYFLVYDHDHFLVYEPAFIRFKFFERICQPFSKKKGFCIYANQ